ncbi:uncharacterized protein [Panulirus ornatus]|uniref:uncharacterized protein n=1 Tax=Panulirus ornatus TaxID=150431 RepID=UPI003A89EF86
MEDHFRSHGFQNERLSSLEAVDSDIQHQTEDLSSEDNSSEGNDVTKEEECERNSFEGEMDENQVNVAEVNCSEEMLSCEKVEYREEMPNAVEFLSIECDTILEPDCNLETGNHLDFKGQGKRQKGRIQTFVAPQGSNPMLPIFYQLPLIAELFRYRGVDVYRRMCKDGPFVKIFHPESFISNGLKESKMKVKHELDDASRLGREHKEESKGNCEPSIPGRPFTKSRSIKNHTRNHTDHVISNCDICRKQFTDKNLYMKHMSTHVSAVGKSYPCTVCEARFTNQASLKSHIQRHFSLKNVQCQFCDKKFPNNSQYIIHKHIHVGEKPYHCQHCEKTFTYKFQFDNHEKTHTDKGLLKCDECKASFSKRQALVIHKRKHTGEKPYKCDKCSAAFRARSYLRAHKNCHTERKLRECPTCGSQFWKSSTLKKHIKAEHSL